MIKGVPQKLFDVEWKSSLAAGERYGLADDEPGLWIYSPGSVGTGLASETVLWSTIDNIGSRYNLIGAVPEPSSLLALGIGLLLLRRRR